MAKPNKRKRAEKLTRSEKIYRDLCVFTHELADEYNLPPHDVAHMLFHIMVDWLQGQFYRPGQVIVLDPPPEVRRNGKA